jgi:flavin-dependent dehydrogenase
MKLFDAIIIGAGPAGCCAALRLVKLGFRVALVEHLAFPRPQIGESVSVGVWNILHFIDAADTIHHGNMLRDLPARVLWERHEAESLPSLQSDHRMMVDRSEFDSRLLNLAKNRGASVFQPASVKRIDGEPGALRCLVADSGKEFLQETLLETRLILDARGRSGQSERKRFPLSPNTFAMWTHVSRNIMPHESGIEALDCGWLWGAPLSNGNYRVMAFLDPQTVKKCDGLNHLFRSILATTQLFKEASSAVFLSLIRTCSATSYVDLERV